VHTRFVSNVTMTSLKPEPLNAAPISLGSISVIVPAFNAVSTLAKTLDSVISQTYPDWELLVVDDGSTDATLSIANEYAGRDSRIHVIRQANGGESAARNAGIAQARYDWLVFLDSDDWIAPSHLEKLASELAAHPDLDAVHCGSVRVTESGIQIPDEYQPPTGDLFPVLARRAAFPVHACMVRKSIVEAVGCLDTSLKTCPDWDLWQRIARAGARFGAVREILAYYRVRPHSSSSRAEQLFRDGMTVLQRGHAPDDRVPQPAPEYVNGLRGDTVESQVFYLLCWGAGLMLGSGQDARVLLEQVRNFHYPALYPDAVAQCILDSGTLPASEPRQAWERLFPSSARNVEQFLEALEAQAQAPGLATVALQKLKRMILRHSPVWKSVIEEDEREAGARQEAERQREHEVAEQRARMDELANRVQELSADRDRILSTIQLREENAALQRDLNSAQHRARERENALQLQLQEARLEHSVFEREMEASRTLHALWQQEMEDARQQHAVFEGELNAATRQHALFLEELDDARRQHSAFERESRAARDRQAELQRQLDVARLRESEVQAELDAARDRESALQAELDAARGRESALQAELDAARGRESALQAELDAARDRESALQAELDAARDRESALQVELDAARGRESDLQREHATLAAEVDSLASALDDSQAQATDLALEKKSPDDALRDLQNTGWNKLGLKLGFIRRPVRHEKPDNPPAVAPVEFSGPPPPGWKWQLLVGPRSAAEIHVAASDPETFRVVIGRAVTQSRWDIQLNRPGLQLQPRRRYTLRFRARADRPRTILVGLAKAYEPWSNLGLSEELLLHPEWQEFREEFRIEAPETNARIHVDLGGRKTAVEFSAFQVYDQDARQLSL